MVKPMMMSTENLNTLDQSVTMSSREIAKLTGITHGEVKRLIKSLETAQRLTQPIMINLYEHEGEMRQEYCLNKRDSLFAVARLSPGFTAEALDRWQDREKMPIYRTSLILQRRLAPGLNSSNSVRQRNNNWRFLPQRRNFLIALCRLKNRLVFANFVKC